MQSLIPVINKLQNVFRKTGVGSSNSIELPQIVVVGSQSCGKSSVLESLVGKSFLPRGTGIVTRCPIVLQLNRLDAEEGDECTEYCSFSDEKDKQYTDFDEVRRQIELRTDKLAGSNKGIAMQAIIVEVFSPKVVPLTVVDLPGLVKNPIGDQPLDIEFQVKEMILKYIKNPCAIILAVSPGNADIATSESIKIAKEVDPEGDRTLAVITKLDLMDKGTDASDVLNGTVIRVKLGIVGVVNRSQYAIDQNVPMKDALKHEREFFRKTYPHKTGAIGTGYLARRLNELLMNHIQETFPTLMKQVKEQLDRYESRQLELGPALAATPEEKAYLLMDVVTEFINKLKIAVKEREGVNVDGQQVYYAVTIADIFEKFNKNLNSHKKELEDERVYEKIEGAIRNSVNVERFTSIEEVFKGLVKEQLIYMQGPSAKCAEDFSEVLTHAIAHCLVDKRLKQLNFVIGRVTRSQLLARLDKVKASIKEYFLTQTGMIFSCDEEFTRLLKVADDKECQDALTATINTHPAFPLGSSINAPSSGQLTYVHSLICGYLSVVRRQTADYIPKHIMRNLFVLMTEELRDAIRKATHGKEGTLIVEPPEIAREREDNTEMLANLHEAMEIISGIRNI